MGTTTGPVEAKLRQAARNARSLASWHRTNAGYADARAASATSTSEYISARAEGAAERAAAAYNEGVADAYDAAADAAHKAGK